MKKTVSPRQVSDPTVGDAAAAVSTPAANSTGSPKSALKRNTDHSTKTEKKIVSFADPSKPTAQTAAAADLLGRKNDLEVVPRPKNIFSKRYGTPLVTKNLLAAASGHWTDSALLALVQSDELSDLRKDFMSYLEERHATQPFEFLVALHKAEESSVPLTELELQDLETKARNAGLGDSASLRIGEDMRSGGGSAASASEIQNDVIASLAVGHFSKFMNARKKTLDRQRAGIAAKQSAEHTRKAVADWTAGKVTSEHLYARISDVENNHEIRGLRRDYLAYVESRYAAGALFRVMQSKENRSQSSDYDSIEAFKLFMASRPGQK